jgi:RNA polymerase sigma factor (sigma-70 family)
MSHDGSVTQLIHDLRSENPAVRDVAARLIWQRYFHSLLELARSHLDKRVRRRTDEEDVAQSMYKSFCLRQQRGEFDLAGRDELWRLLVTITLRKARNAVGAQRRRKRDIARDRPLTVEGTRNSHQWILEEMDAAVPTPAEAMVLNEALERRLDALGDKELRQISLWRLEGYTNREIAERLNCTERSIERKVGRVRTVWRSFDDGGGP